MKEDFQKRVCANPAYTSADKIVACALCWFINRRTRTAWPSYELLAKVTGLHRVTVIDSIKKLAELGDIRIMRRRIAGNIKNQSNIYIPRLEARAVDNSRPHLRVVVGGDQGVVAKTTL